MPVNFERIPPRVAVPPPPRASVALWAGLFFIITCSGAGLATVLWADSGRDSTLWFWYCAVIFPMLIWGLVLCIYRGLIHARRAEAMAINRVSEKLEQAQHQQASLPLHVMGYAWCLPLAGDVSAERVLSGNIKMSARTSAAYPDIEVRAHWLDVPGRRFYSGNVLLEHERHQALCRWLVPQLVGRVRSGLAELPARTTLNVDVYVHPLVDPTEVAAQVEDLILAEAPHLQVGVRTSAQNASLFLVDAWHDQSKPQHARLLVSLQMQRAISHVLPDGAVEAAVAILVAHPDNLTKRAAPLHLHRPSKGGVDHHQEVLDLALRWSGVTAAQVQTIWGDNVPTEIIRPIPPVAEATPRTDWVDVKTTVGDCGMAGSWLAVALALDHARQSGNPQLVVSRSATELIAIGCGV
ncbi:hypothetical protein EPAKOI_001211 [Cupriavidus sp. H18C2]